MTKTARGGCSDGVIQTWQQIKDCEEDTGDDEVAPADSCADGEAHATTKVMLYSSSTCGWDC